MDYTEPGAPRIVRSDASSHDIRRELHRVHRGVYVQPGVRLSYVERIQAALMRAGDGAVAAGLSAFVLHGATYFDPEGDIEIIRNLDGQGRMRGRVRVIRTDQLEAADVQLIDGILVTTPVRTAYDLGRRKPDWLALARLDELARATGLDVTELWSYTRDHPRTHGVPRIRELLAHIDPKAESPGESWLRLTMLRNGFPRPESQIVLMDSEGRKIAQFDLGYRRLRVGIDYDGVDFHTSDEHRAHDSRRDCAARRKGWEVVRVKGEPLSHDPHAVMNTIDIAIQQQGLRYSA